MKKIFTLTSLIVITASVFGMNNFTFANSSRVSKSGKQSIENLSDLVKVELETRRLLVKRFLKISEVKIREDIFNKIQSKSDWLLNDELLTSLIKLLSPKKINDFFSKIVGEKSEIKDKTKEQAKDILITNRLLSETMRFVNSGDIVQLLTLGKNQIPVSRDKIEPLCNSVFGNVSDLFETLCQKYTLHYACEKDYIKIVKYLVEHGADVNKENPQTGITPLFMTRGTPLMVACKSGNETIVKYLVEHGVDVNKENRYGRTPLLVACFYGNESIVKYLIEKGANVNKKDHWKETPLSAAYKSGQENIVEYLRKHGARTCRSSLNQVNAWIRIKK